MLRTALRASRGVVRTPLLTPSSFTVARRFLSQEVRAKLQDAVSSTPVVLFMKGTPEAPQCGFSRATVQILDIQGVPAEKLKTFNVLEDAELRTAIKEFSEWPTIPQVYVNGEFLGGCDIILGMHQSGELETLLEKSGVIPPVEASDAKVAPA
ncbi:hypothetical protein EUX98_g4676 [Antrodiella citrinella]|uniref:Monothiol glutaredoxin-5, mitochondrial n=1 Tax=Antrodiella citrinella TaxID=2447956 RepID=A0A4S4MTG3_9APHY|nr:hypothetical protein EUX98_g4676 [Antrodiella citrinella]